ncbi:bile acid:sodium symporter family protein [Halomonas ramblicola]|uniref:bile acid:sodium symporter family protein n=1 Tax=Halomonas ramblicola TaxID=747349 RepID=UPI0025B329BE|nr:bile acid:sodium symporter family protein [Halomonas ramblicola]MDN3523023.1 bile acid:sodium symporter family protein [Halomonas ramblicola]
MGKWFMMIVMFGMGLTLTSGDFKPIVRHPWPLVVGVVCQFVIMPALAFGIATVLQLSPELTLGLVLVGSVAGGIGSNVMVYMSKGDVALSVAMTTFSTLISAIATPALMLLYMNQLLPVPAANLVMSIIQVVVIPVTIGALLRSYMPRATREAARTVPLVSAIGMVLILAPMVAINQELLVSVAGVLIIAGILHNVGGLFLGYTVSAAFKMPVPQRRAISIEVGMQNSALAAMLAHVHFDPITALPAVFISVWTMLFLPILANRWRFRDEKAKRSGGVKRHTMTIKDTPETKH